MFSKSLFKQSCKAHGTMWAIITFAVCFMLATVMLIAGGSNLSTSKEAFQDTIIEGELNSQIQDRTLSYYVTSDKALEFFDNTFIVTFTEVSDSSAAKKVYEDTYNKLIIEGESPLNASIKAMEAQIKYISNVSYRTSINELTNYINDLADEKGIDKLSSDYKELYGLIFTVLNPIVDEDGNHLLDNFYIINNEEPARYNMEALLDSSMTLEKRALYRKEYASSNAQIFLAGNLIQEENIEMILNELASYGVTFEKYASFGFNDYNKLKSIANQSLIDFRANFAYRMENIKEGETEESIINDLTKDITSSLLSSLPGEISEALEEIGQMDLYGTLVGSIFFKMAGLLLPIIYMIMTANSLIAGQVDSGSMAYILSTSTKRRTVVFTQAMYLILSLLAMFTCTSIVSLICLAIVDVETGLNVGKVLLLNLGAFIVMFAMSGICFFTSCWFNRSKRSMAIGGGLTMFFLVATMLGLFGSPVIPSLIRMNALNAFNYVSLISLFDVVNILDGGTMFIYKFVVLLVVGIVLYITGSKKFETKDLPL